MLKLKYTFDNCCIGCNGNGYPGSRWCCKRGEKASAKDVGSSWIDIIQAESVGKWNYSL